MKLSSRYVLCFWALLALGLAACSRQPGPLPPAPTPTPTGTPWPIPPTPAPMPALTPGDAVDPSALLPYIPDSSFVLSALQTELDGDEQRETVVLLGFGGAPDRLGYDRLELLVLELDRGPEQGIVWHSAALAGDRGEALQARDITGDGRAEVLSVQSLGAAGETLYVLAYRDGGYGWLEAQGGYCAGLDHFGELGARLQDLDSDGLPEILASYGPAATSTDVYKWDGQQYAYGITLLDK